MMTEAPPATAVTAPPHHHLFGFHDLVVSNAAGDKLLCLRIERIDHPPLSGQAADVGYAVPGEQRFVKIAESCAFNYPQGARQQWVGDSEVFCVNDREGDQWVARFYDANTQQQVQQTSYAIHYLDRAGKFGYGMNYARLYRLGGYGYIGLPDPFADDPAPAADGIFRVDVAGGRHDLIASIADLAACDGSAVDPAGHHHYLTHLVLNPAQTRIAFLHRFRLADGGERTRLMTVGVDGSDLRCLASGTLSHFDWADDRQVMIWGKRGGAVDALRSSALTGNPVAAFALKHAKAAAKLVLRRGGRGRRGTGGFAFMFIEDSQDASSWNFPTDVLTCDGHPMFCPTGRDWFVNDTYPDADGVRTLMLCQVSTKRRIDLGKFKMLDAKPDIAMAGPTMKPLSAMVARDFAANLFAFTRSGLHCDLHPRWCADGRTVAFDSIHEGTRQLYTCPVGELMSGGAAE
jgi:hypothetical protein